MSQLDDQGINNNSTQIKIDNNITKTESILTNSTTTSSSNSPTITPELTRKERQYIKQNQLPSVSSSVTDSPTTVANNDSSGYRPTLQQQTTRDRIFTWPPTTSPAPTIHIVTDSPTTVKRWKNNNRDSATEEGEEVDSPTDSPIEKKDIETKEIRESASPTLQVTQSNTKRRDRKKNNQLVSNTTDTVEPNSTEPDSTEEEADTTSQSNNNNNNNNNKQSQPTQYPTYLGTTYYPTLSWPTYTPTTFGERPNYIQKMITQREKKELARQQALEEAERLAAGELGSEGVGGVGEGSSKSPSGSQVPTTNTHAYGTKTSVSRPLSHGGLGTELIPTPSPNSTPTKQEKKDEQQEEENGYQGRGYQDVADSRTGHAFSRFDSTPQPTAKPIVNEEEVYLRFANDGLSCNNATKDECKLLVGSCTWDKQSGSCDEAQSVSPTESSPYDTSGRTWGGRGGGSQPTGRYSTFIDDTDSPTPSLEEEVEETYEETSRWKPRTSSPTNEDTPLPSYSPTISPISTDIPSYSPTISPIVPQVEEVFERFVNPEPRVSSSDEDNAESGGLSLKFHVPEKEPQQTTKLSLTFQVPTSTSPTLHPISSNPTSDEPTYFVFPTFSPTVHVVDTPIPTLWPSYMPTVGRAKRDISDDGFIVPLPEEGTTQEVEEELTIYEKRMCKEYPNGIHPNSKKVDELIVFMYGIQVSSSTTDQEENDGRVSIEQEVEKLQLSILNDVAKHLLICPTDKKDDEISSSSLVRSSFTSGHRSDQYVSRVYYMEDESIATLSKSLFVHCLLCVALSSCSYMILLLLSHTYFISFSFYQVNALQQFLVLQTVQLLRVPSI